MARIFLIVNLIKYLAVAFKIKYTADSKLKPNKIRLRFRLLKSVKSIPTGVPIKKFLETILLSNSSCSRLISSFKLLVSVFIQRADFISISFFFKRSGL